LDDWLLFACNDRVEVYHGTVARALTSIS